MTSFVLCGRNDAPAPRHLHEELADGIPGARLHVIEHCGHLSTLERLEAVTGAMCVRLGAAEAGPEKDYRGP